MRCIEQRDRPKTEARRLVERRGLSITDLLTLVTFSVVRAVRGRPVDVLFISDPVVRNDSTHRSTVSRSGIASSRAVLNCRRKIRWTVTTESLFLKKLLDDKNAVLNVPLLHGYWTDPVGTILRRSVEVADLHSPDYYPFKRTCDPFAPRCICLWLWTAGYLKLSQLRLYLRPIVGLSGWRLSF